ELLIKLAEPRLDLFEIVREALHLRGHRVQARARVGLHVLHRFLQTGHRRVQPIYCIARLLDERFLDGVVLGHLRLQIFLTLQDGSRIALEFDDLAGHGHDGFGADQAAGNSAGEHGPGEKQNVTNTHDQNLRKMSTAGREGSKSTHCSPNLPMYWQKQRLASGSITKEVSRSCGWHRHSPGPKTKGRTPSGGCGL